VLWANAKKAGASQDILDQLAKLGVK